MGEKIAVLSPMGFAPKVTRKTLAPRLPPFRPRVHDYQTFL
ncbi:MAG TPA: hypothetical protein VGV06_20035 [Methylomirabilota bacterium]|nr:hypothetical protein [Methylomirabilota bacterium]